MVTTSSQGTKDEREDRVLCSLCNAPAVKTGVLNGRRRYYCRRHAQMYASMLPCMSLRDIVPTRQH